MPTTNLRITPLSPLIGAEVSGVDLAQPLDAGTLAELESAWAAHLVLFFREQKLRGGPDTITGTFILPNPGKEYYMSSRHKS